MSYEDAMDMLKDEADRREEEEAYRDELEAENRVLRKRNDLFIAALAKYADHDNWPTLESDDGDDADPLWFDLQGEAVYCGWRPAEDALIAAGLCKRDGDYVVEVEPGTVWPAASSEAKENPNA